eukprot:6704205-Pyramimonas_sp.AAC.2
MHAPCRVLQRRHARFPVCDASARRVTLSARSANCRNANCRNAYCRNANCRNSRCRIGAAVRTRVYELQNT